MNKDPSILGSSMEVKENVRTLLSDFMHLYPNMYFIEFQMRFQKESEDKCTDT